MNALRQPESLKLYQIHTGETLERVFRADDEYLPDALADLNRLLRDHRTNEIAAIDPALLSLLARLSALVSPGDTVHVISGYRSPATNRLLAAATDGVAKNSLHMEGRAIDIRIPGRDTAELRDAALSLRGGGVGFYPESRFIHIDTGRVRTW